MEPDWARPVVHWEIIARDPVAQAESLGATLTLPPFDVPDGPTIGGIEDPGAAGTA